MRSKQIVAQDAFNATPVKLFRFLPAKGLQARKFYKASLQEDGDQCEPRTWWSVTYRD